MRFPEGVVLGSPNFVRSAPKMTAAKVLRNWRFPVETMGT
jgi:hypothetical protein